MYQRITYKLEDRIHLDCTKCPKRYRCFRNNEAAIIDNEYKDCVSVAYERLYELEKYLLKHINNYRHLLYRENGLTGTFVNCATCSAGCKCMPEPVYHFDGVCCVLKVYERLYELENMIDEINDYTVYDEVIV